MAENTAIEWTDHTFNPWWGCQKVSPACDHCYAERDAKRFAPGRVLWGVGSERRIFDPATDSGRKHWAAPLKWAKNDPARLGRRPRVFCASMADWLDLDAPIEEFVRLLDIIRLTPELDWLLLSKRIGNLHRIATAALVAGSTGNEPLRSWLVDWWSNGKPPANVWLGATVVNQAEADRDIPKLLQVPAAVRFLSVEPMLGPIDLTAVTVGGGHGHHEFDPIITGNALRRAEREAPHLHWVIVGGESGPGARPMHPDWARSLRDQCAAAGVPFLFKQWGEWLPAKEGHSITGKVLVLEGSAPFTYHPKWHDFADGQKVARIGKKAAGRQLDGRTHDGFPA
jgi:protein gp37